MSMSGQQIGEEHVVALSRYLEDLWKRQEPLARRAGRPNLTAIAAACGFDRGVFYSNSGAADLLDSYQEKDRIRFYDKLDQGEMRRERNETASKQNQAFTDRIIQLEALVQAQARELDRLRRLEKLMCVEGILPP